MNAITPAGLPDPRPPSCLPFRRRGTAALLPTLPQCLSDFAIRPIPEISGQVHVLCDLARLILRRNRNEILPLQVCPHHFLACSKEDRRSSRIGSGLSQNPKGAFHQIPKRPEKLLPCIHRFGGNVAREEAVDVNVFHTLLRQDVRKLAGEEDGGEFAAGVAPAAVYASGPFDAGWGREEAEIELLAAHVEGGACDDDSRITIFRGR